MAEQPVTFLKSISKREQHPKCAGYRTFEGDFDCGYQTTLACEDCKYSGMGRKDPEAAKNSQK
jgi:hypothetical protein